MRLIDADELLKHKTDHEMISTHLIYNMPTIEAEPVRRGRWEEFRVSGWYCSLCNYQISDRYGKHRYCPNCGALMEESE